ncbi:MAG: nucleotidyltransferase family protein [Planctomycetaceae bacterium]|nr:nucleotidyltransferase family protein [Planctomycetaceae bacterium]
MRAFAVLPAAGRSLRMGSPKLLLPWPAAGGDRTATVVEHVVATWKASRVEAVVVTVHPDDARLAELCRAAGAEVVVPSTPPPDMKASIRAGLEFLAERYRPDRHDIWLTAPADLPLLTTTSIDLLIEAAETHPGVCLRPRYGDRYGHPVVWPWSFAADVAGLAADEGLNALLQRISWQVCDAGPACVSGDLDTPADYAALRARQDRYDR